MMRLYQRNLYASLGETAAEATSVLLRFVIRVFKTAWITDLDL